MSSKCGEYVPHSLSPPQKEKLVDIERVNLLRLTKLTASITYFVLLFC